MLVLALIAAVAWPKAVPWIVGLCGLIAAAGLGIALFRSGTGQAIAILRDTIEVLEGKLSDNEAERKLLREQVALLETRTSLEPMVAAVIDQFEGHESRASERHAATLKVLDLVAHRLGPDPEHAHGQ